MLIKLKMNSDEVGKSSNSDDSNSSSAGPSNSINSENDNKMMCNETIEPAGDENNISLNDFLDFLKVSCHVNDMITNSVQPKSSTARTSSKSTTNVDFEKLAKNRLVNDLHGHNTSGQHISGRGIKPTTEQDTNDRLRFRRRTASVGGSVTNKHGTKKPETPKRGLHPRLNEKLDYMLNEGVMDSILPFICPVPAPKAFSRQTGGRHKQKESQGAEGNDYAEGGEKVQQKRDSAKHGGSARRRSALGSRGGRTKSVEKKESEVVIHVCDEVKNTSRDFVCPQSLLVRKMGYFADVTAGQKLEDMDISVHCDIQIFEWLMRWVKYSSKLEHATSSAEALAESEPELDASNVVPILVSASFLQMEPLLVDCLAFCHARLSDVVRASTNLTCLNDTILTRLAAMFTNVELEWVRDKKERVTPRLWTKLIQSLCEPEPEALRGHYYSLAGLFRCSKCSKCLTKTMETFVSCQPANIRINRWGQLVSQHVRDPAWDMSTFISQLFKELKSWRLVYWKLWGHCHYLHCFICEMPFPVFQMTWCRYHPESPQFLGPSSEGRNTGPAGRYPCCGQQAFRFETLPGPIGCQFREHSVQVETDRERAIHSITQLVAENYALCENPSSKLKESITSSDLPQRWAGISLTPRGVRQGLLPVLNAEESTVKSARRLKTDRAYLSESSSNSESSDDMDQSLKAFGASARSYYSSSSDGCESECNRGIRRSYNKKGSKRQAEKGGRYWSGEISARSNQDHQREFEEKVMKKVIAIVTKKTASEHSLPTQTMPIGGSYLRLEAEWKDLIKQRSSNTNILATSNSNTNITTSKQRNK